MTASSLIQFVLILTVGIVLLLEVKRRVRKIFDAWRRVTKSKKPMNQCDASKIIHPTDETYNHTNENVTLEAADKLISSAGPVGMKPAATEAWLKLRPLIKSEDTILKYTLRSGINFSKEIVVMRDGTIIGRVPFDISC